MHSPLKLNGVNKIFSRSTVNEVVALCDVSLTVAPGDFVIVIGPNGSGKSSLLKAIFEGEKTSGQIFLGDLDVAKLTIHERSAFISYLTQSSEESTIGEFSILENLRLASFKGYRNNKESIVGGLTRNEVVENLKHLKLGLAERLNSPVGDLSGGERQLIATLMALQGTPSLLLCDEPTASIDETRVFLLEELVTESVKDNKTPVLWITHDIEQIMRLGNRILAMKAGRVVHDIGAAEKATLSKKSVMSLIRFE
jgi:putative ABC transport system ATP-binding protein